MTNRRKHSAGQSDKPAETRRREDRQVSSAAAITVPILRVQVTPMTAAQTVTWIDGRGDGRALLLNHNLHSVYYATVDPEFSALYELADRVIIDGAPIRLLSSLRVRGGLISAYRVGSTDWISLLSASKAPGVLAVVGATPESNLAAVGRLSADLMPFGWSVVGRDGYGSWESIVTWLNEVRPKLALVGLGMPLQEQFIRSNWSDLPPAVYATVGGAIDYVAGANRLAPRWVGRLGVEWVWRLAHEPRRLAGRYLVEPFKLVLVLLQRSRTSRVSNRQPSGDA